MAEETEPETLDYPGFLQDALRDMVRRVLEYVAEYGLPGEHHFYIGFATQYPGVVIPPVLRDQYPEAMKIVLQYKYWDLEVDQNAFSVSLSFGGTPHRLTVPFEALLEFQDPAANLGMAFEPGRVAGLIPEESEPDPEPEPPEPSKPAEVIQFPKRPR